MKNFHRLLILLLVLITKISIGHAQIWPYSSMIRFGNTVYYPIDSLSVDKLTGTSISFDKKIKDRYFDILLGSDSLGLSINDTLIYFYQKDRVEPKCYKEILFYKRRKLRAKNVTIKYLKILDITKDEIITQATIRNFDNSKKRKNIMEVHFPVNQIEGIFLGTGKNERIFASIFAGVAWLTGLIIL